MFIYIITNKDWDFEQKYKYGLTTNPINRLTNYHPYSPNPFKYIFIGHIVKLNNYIINLTEYDEIFSQIGINKELIEQFENEYNTKLPFLRQITKYIINNDFITCEGMELIPQIINEEFPKIGLYADKIYNDDELNQVNQSVYQSIHNQYQRDIENLFIKRRNTQEGQSEVNQSISRKHFEKINKDDGLFFKRQRKDLNM